MSKVSTVLQVLVAGVACCGFVSVATAAVGDRCFADWSTAAPVVQAEALASARDVHEQARRQRIGDIVRMTLCTDQERFVYRLMVRDSRGAMRVVVVDAKTPFAVAVGENALPPTQKH